MSKYLIEELHAISEKKWWTSDVDQREVARVLNDISMDEHLQYLLERCLSQQELIGLSESLKSLFKVVLYNNVNKTRLRLHVFKEGAYELVHNHKWPFISKVVSGKLINTLYRDIDNPLPSVITEHNEGDVYLLMPDVYHKLEAEKGTITLVLRGPDLIDESVWLNKVNNQSWKHVGGKTDARKADLNRDELKVIIDSVINRTRKI